MGLPNVIGYSSLAGDLRASPHQVTRERLEALSKAECSTSMTPPRCWRHPDAIARLHLAAAVLPRLANTARGDEAGLDYPRVLLQEANRRPTSWARRASRQRGE